ncbi:hypothetical protein BpHYR1_027919 [Brachionus plicatilis]|uniref:Uncharacterized protein n=1 Tax=Brachionus plicatilis TaxID=10195 RepID=A0A3M7T896_BRAPC|nr:hypothetical protein BpHYR1_027919 [Brachionus plicatilis]
MNATSSQIVNTKIITLKQISISVFLSRYHKKIIQQQFIISTSLEMIIKKYAPGSANFISIKSGIKFQHILDGFKKG